MTTQVYWIRAEHHSDVTSEGYVGVSRNANKRWAYGHKWAHAKGRHENPRLSNAITKHGWDNLVKTVLVVADEAYCYELEQKLRPSDSIGWNLAMGGCKPPVSKSRGPDYVSPLKGVPRPTPWLIGNTRAPSIEACAAGGKKAKGRKQTPEQVAKRVAARRATLESQGRTH
jgi:hypothetical protein